MQCFRCGAFVSDDFTCPSCGAALEIGQDVCPACASPILCAHCSGGMEQVVSMQSAPPGADGAIQTGSTALLYEYSSVQFPLYISQDENESAGHFQQRFHNEVMKRIASSSLEGWETVDPIEYTLLRRNGMITGGMLSLLGRHVVTIRLKRLMGGPRDSSEADAKEDLPPPL